MSYYSVIGGWVIRYTLGSAAGAYLGSPAAYFDTVASGLPALGFHALFMLIAVVIVALGVAGGIERATTIMVPAIVVLLVGIAVYAVTLPGATEGYAYFLSPDFGTIAANAESVVPAAVGQALFSLSLGFSVMITYASYVGEDDNLGIDGLSIAAFNTGVGVLAGLVVFPLLFAQGVSPETAGPGAIFVSIPTALADVPGSRIVGAVFFFVVLIAALSSAISLLEVLVSYVVDNFGHGRERVAAFAGLVIFLLGIPSALDIAWLGWFDGVAVNLFLPLVVTLVVIFVGWLLADDAVAELREGTRGGDGIARLWLWTVRTVVLVAVVLTLALGVLELAGPENAYVLPPL
jgi:NSS family neurotransmitter:Na+ symporter